MNCLLERLPSGGRVAAIRLRSLGDCVLTTPALQMLHEYRPDLRIGVVVESRFAAVFEGHPAVDRVLLPSVAAMANWRPNLTINFHGGTRSVVLTVASAAAHRAGFQHFRGRWAYNVVMPRAQQVLGVERKVHTAEHLASGVFFMGVPRREIPRASLVAESWDRGAPYAVVHPFASAPAKTWAAERFVEVARELRREGLEPLILCGPGDDAGTFGEFEVLRGLPLSQVKAALAGAVLFVGNDSGPAHVAAALGVPVTVLYGPSDSVVWAPWKAVAAESLVAGSMDEISTADVLRAVARLRVRC